MMEGQDERPADVESSSDEEDMDVDDEAEKRKEAELAELDRAVSSDPTNYQAHVDRTKLLRSMGELVRLRAAREDFSKAYPLTTELWLEWLEDEKGLATTEEDKKKIFDLFDRATKDYVSVKLWLEYCQYSLSGLGSAEGIAKARATFEQAIVAVGLNPKEGAHIWEAYREFEEALVAMAATEENKKSQKDRVDKLFRRQLSVPLLDMEGTLEEYREWRGGVEPDKALIAIYNDTLKLLKEREPFEDALLKAEGDEAARLEEYNRYVAFEMEKGMPVRIQSLCERRITDHCLVPSVWTEYLKYLDHTLKNPEVSLPAYKRATRNCPWFGELWVAYLRCLERNEKEPKEVVCVFEAALMGGVSGEDLLNVWMAFIDYKRRQMRYDDYQDSDRKEKEAERDAMRELFGKAVDHLARMGADAECKVARYWATMEGDRFRSMDEARRIWSDVCAAAGDGSKAWAEYISMEKAFGDTKHLRKLFPKALERCKDWPETIGDMWVQFEREEGTLSQLEEAEAKVSKRMKRVREERAKVEELEREEEERKLEKREKKVEKDKEKRRERRHEQAEAKKRKFTQDGKDAGFKVPQAPDSSAKSETAKEAKTIKPPPGFKPPPGYKPPSEPTSKKSKLTEEAEEEDKSSRTVFLSNLDFSVTEEQLESALSSSGKILEIRLVKNAAGRSKGFAYVEFSSKFEAERALARDREPLQGRPMFVSEMNKGHQFKYETGKVEEKKLFVSKLPTSCDKAVLEETFGPYGKIVDIRIVTKRNGESKGIAFVEYEEAKAAKAAIQGADNTLIGGKMISVALSCPPARKQHSQDDHQQQPSLGSGSREQGSRRGRVQVAFVPRSLQVGSRQTLPQSANGDKSSANGSGGDRPRSNEDFRNLVLNKK